MRVLDFLREAAGPHGLTRSRANTHRFDNVLALEAWLASDNLIETETSFDTPSPSEGSDDPAARAPRGVSGFFSRITPAGREKLSELETLETYAKYAALEPALQSFVRNEIFSNADKLRNELRSEISTRAGQEISEVKRSADGSLAALKRKLQASVAAVGLLAASAVGVSYLGYDEASNASTTNSAQTQQISRLESTVLGHHDEPVRAKVARLVVEHPDSVPEICACKRDVAGSQPQYTLCTATSACDEQSRAACETKNPGYEC